MQTNKTEPIDQVINRFPTHQDTIKELNENSRTFGEICDDYAEMVTWIEKNCQPENQALKNCDYARELLKDLEAEIIDCLDGDNKLVNDECMGSKAKLLHAYHSPQ